MRLLVLLLVLGLSLSGCTGEAPAPSPAPHGDDADAPDGRTPPGPGGDPDVPDEPGADPATPSVPFEATGCDVDYLEFTLEKSKVEPYVPPSLETFGSHTAVVVMRIFECDALLLGNQSVQHDGWFALTSVRVTNNGTEWDATYYLLEAFTGWPALEGWFAQHGMAMLPGSIAVARSPEGTEGTLAAADLEYAFQALPRDPGENTYPLTENLLLAGTDAGTRMAYSYSGPTKQPLVSAMAVDATGGVLGDLVGTGPGFYQYNRLTVLMHETT